MKRTLPLLLAAFALGACATLKAPFSSRPAPTPAPPTAADGAALTLDKVQAALAALQTNADLAGRAPAAMKDAVNAVAEAGAFQHDPDSGAQRLYVADRKVATAEALAEAEYYRTRIEGLSAAPAAPR